MVTGVRNDVRMDAPDYYRRRKTLTRHLHGDGIEIGALYNPLDLTGAAITRIRYVDRFNVSGLREQYPSLDHLPFVPVDIVDDGEVLSSVPNGSLDFVIANSMIEHTSDPIGTLRHWLEKLRPGGVLYFTMPDKRVGWDVNRPITTIAHLLADYHDDPALRKRRDRAHFVEWCDLMNREYIHEGDDASLPADIRALSAAERRDATVEHLIAIDYSIHYHVFTHHTFLALLDYLRQALQFPFEVVDAAPPLAESWESVFVLRRLDAPVPSVGGPVTQPVPDIAPDDAAPPSEADAVALAKMTVRLWQAETRAWEANTRAWQAEQNTWRAETQAWEANTRAWQAETRAWEAETALWNANARLHWLETTVIPTKNAALTASETYITRIEKRLPVRVIRFIWRVIGPRLQKRR